MLMGVELLLDDSFAFSLYMDSIDMSTDQTVCMLI